VKASETSLQPVIEGTKQYVVPLFQRTYSWDTKEWEMLWQDLIELCEDEDPRDHFIGSIVTMPTASVPQGIAKYLLIDGQQRLTTIFILLALLRDAAKTSNGSMLSQEIEETLLTNRFKQGNDVWKLLPTQADRKAFIQLLEVGDVAQQTRIAKAAAFFKRRLRSPEAPDLETLKKVIVDNLMLVSIVLDPDDNPHLIFESLNAKGKPLSQADLIRNYFFMRIHVDDQEQLYEKSWEPMQERLGDSLTECIRHFLMKDGAIVKKGEVYFALKERADGKSQQEVIVYLQEVSRFADYYAKLLQPDGESSPKLRERMKRLNRIEVTVAYPFLLNVYNDYANEQIDEDEFSDVMEVIENFMIRRLICRVPTNQLNKIFPALYAQASEADSLVEGLKESLRTKNYPRDTEFRERFVSSRLYTSGDRAKTKLILERLESSFGNKEAVPYDNLSVEHVMPQMLTDWWRQHLGEDFEATHELMLHTIGNLTLTGYNPELSNADFPHKRQLFKESHLSLNKWFVDQEKWDEETILIRAESLAEVALSIWAYFGSIEDDAPTTAQTVTGTTPTSVVILGQRFSVSSWRDVAQKTLETVADLDQDSFEQILVSFPRFVAQSGDGFRSPRQLSNGDFIETHLSASDINKFCIQAVEVAGLSPEDWFVETL
jgi:uncharacterized protein with ParB-like and HNH nuclease domain